MHKLNSLRHCHFSQGATGRGFTIVELLIVIVVIAILASVSVAAYVGIQGRAHDAAVQSDLRQFAQVMAADTVTNGYRLGSAPVIGTYLESLQWKASQDSYETDVDRNLVLCLNRWNNRDTDAPWSTPTTNRQNWAFVALSKSGSIFYVTDTQPSPQVYEGETPMVFDATELVCGVVIDEIGTEGFGELYHGYNQDDTSTGPWRAWTRASS